MGALTCKDTPALKTTKSYAEAIAPLVLKLEKRFMCTHPSLQRLFYELPVIKDPRAKNISTLILMQEFDYIVREAREIFEHNNLSCEHPVIDEILYNKEYMMRYVFKDNHTYDENTIKEVPLIHIIQ